jgi:hypothetical protein
MSQLRTVLHGHKGISDKGCPGVVANCLAVIGISSFPVLAECNVGILKCKGLRSGERGGCTSTIKS